MTNLITVLLTSQASCVTGVGAIAAVALWVLVSHAVTNETHYSIAHRHSIAVIGVWDGYYQFV